MKRIISKKGMVGVLTASAIAATMAGSYAIWDTLESTGTATLTLEKPVVAETVSPVGTNVSYKLDDIKVLRKWGYTANELEVASRDGISAKALVEQAKKDREAAQREALKEVSDTASPEYQNLLNKTWLGGDPIDLTGVDPNIVYNTETWTENVDYEKCGAQGTQLFIKLYLDNGTAAFMSVTPGRYVELADSGNIVVNLEALTSENLCVITKVTEVRVN